MPIVIAIEAIVVIDPMFAGQKLQLGKAGRVSKQEVDVGIAGEVLLLNTAVPWVFACSCWFLGACSQLKPNLNWCLPLVQDRSSRVS